MSVLTLGSAIRQFLTWGEPAASRAADDRWSTDKVRRRARFADRSRDNRLAHQRRCEHDYTDCDANRTGPPA